jgi:hypothetical protein
MEREQTGMQVVISHREADGIPLTRRGLSMNLDGV